MPNRLLIGLGAQGTAGVMSALLSQNLKPSIYERYLSGLGGGDWTTWNSPAGAYVSVVAGQAESIGAVPMFTLYQMAQNGGSNLSGLSDSTFMSAYWANARLMFQMIGLFGKPTLVNLEPDFWGFAQVKASGGDPTKLFADVNSNPDCAALSNDIVGIAGCLMAMALGSATGLRRLSALRLWRAHPSRQRDCVHERDRRAACGFHRRPDRGSRRRLLRDHEHRL